jgi:hypothetical protein
MATTMRGRRRVNLLQMDAEKTSGCYQKVTNFVNRIGTDARRLAANLHYPQHIVVFH